MNFLHKLIDNRIVHYGIAGGTAFVVEYGSFLVMYYVMRWLVVLSNSLSFTFGLITSFTLNRKWVFGHLTHKSKTSHQFFAYLLVALANLLITNIAILFLAKSIPVYIAKVLLILLVACWNFVLFKKVIFKPETQDLD